MDWGGGPRILGRFEYRGQNYHCFFTINFFSCSSECEHCQQGGLIGGGPRIRDRLSRFEFSRHLICNISFWRYFSVAPVSVNIVNKVDRLVVGRESEIVCRSTGSRPPAHITWYLGGQRLEGGGTESVSIGQRPHWAKSCFGSRIDWLITTGNQILALIGAVEKNTGWVLGSWEADYLDLVACSWLILSHFFKNVEL